MAVRIIIIIARKVMNITNMSPKYVAHGPSVCAVPLLIVIISRT